MKMNDFKKITTGFLTIVMFMSFLLPSFAADESKLLVPPEELAYINETQYQGEGMVVAVIDKSFNLNLSHWKLTDESTAKITEDTLKKLKGDLNAEKFEYYNAKIPFVYNYSSKNTDVLDVDIHGTHIAGVIGGNDKDAESGFRGIVPEAQLLFMCVFTQNNKSDTDSICQAIEDAIVLGADVINMSVGIIAGMEDGYPFDEKLAEMILKAEEAGISVICAAGNSGNNYTGSYYSSLYGIDLPIVNVVDNGTIASPASMDSAIAVGSVSENYSSFYYITLNDENQTKIKFVDTTSTELPELGGSFTELFDGKTLDYVVVPGIGTPEDYEDIDVDGKIALIARGEISFIDKLLNAEENGAVGAVIYNNVETEGAGVSMAINGAGIPAVFISMEDGLIMADDSLKPQTITIEDGKVYYFESVNKGVPLLTSSAGPTPNLMIKPDVLAIGSNLLSLSSEGDYRRLTGTSMSAGCVSGVTALLKQYLRENNMPDDPAYVRKILINSAVPTSYGDRMFSPRIQGGGIVDIESMLNTQILITGSDGRAKIELGDKLKNNFKIDYTLTNITDEPLTVMISAALLTDDYVTFDVTEPQLTAIEESDSLPYFINDINIPITEASVFADLRYTNVNINSDGYKEYKIELGAGESRDLTLNVYLNDSFIKNNQKIFTEGFYIDGFIFAEVVESDSVSSVPFLGFYGDWTNLSVYDNFAYEGNLTYFNESYMYTYIEYEGIMMRWLSGLNFIDNQSPAEMKHIAFSPNFDRLADEIYLSLALLRYAEITEMTLTDPKGEIVDELEQPVTIQKSIAAIDYFNIMSLLLWTGDDGVNPLYIFPDGEYKLNITFRPIIENAKEQKITIPIILDTTMPEMVSYNVTETDEGLMISINCADNHCVQAVTFYDTFANIYYDVPNTHTHKCGEAEFEILLDEFIENGTRYLYVDIYDYAFNCATVKIDLMDYID